MCPKVLKAGKGAKSGKSGYNNVIHPWRFPTSQRISTEFAVVEICNGIPSTDLLEPQHEKTYLPTCAKWRFRFACVFVVWSESSLGTSWITKDAKFLYVDNKDWSDSTDKQVCQTACTHRLILVSVGCICHKVRFLMFGLTYSMRSEHYFCADIIVIWQCSRVQVSHWIHFLHLMCQYCVW